MCARYNFFNLPVSENVHNKILERKVLSNDRIITTQGSLLSSAWSQGEFILFVKQKVLDSKFPSGHLLTCYLKFITSTESTDRTVNVRWCPGARDVGNYTSSLSSQRARPKTDANHLCVLQQWKSGSFMVKINKWIKRLSSCEDVRWSGTVLGSIFSKTKKAVSSNHHTQNLMFVPGTWL